MRCQQLQEVFEVQSFGFDTGGPTIILLLVYCPDTGPQSFCYSFIALSIIRCSRSAQKFTVRMCHVTTVAMATTQLVLTSKSV